MIRLYLSLLLLPAVTIGLSAQIVNDDCSTALALTNVQNYCSANGEFSNSGANSTTEFGVTDCFEQDAPDVWFSFTATATTVNISVTGATSFNEGGSLRNPQLGLYAGSCGNLGDPVQCFDDAFSENFIQFFASDLELGRRYYIRVGSISSRVGTFRLCVNNYNPRPNTVSDCFTGINLCDKSPFSLQAIDNFGTQQEELPDVFCTSGGGRFPITEEQSAWLNWICDDPGSLTFDITPLNPTDDIDWVLYELPRGVDDCSEKKLLRYNISGANRFEPLEEWIACTGATGMREDDDDEGENCGCQPGDNNYSRSIDMESGKAYTLVIFNFSETGNGFTVNFGGTGTFLGPDSDFSTSVDSLGFREACVGKPVEFSDLTTSVDPIVGWEWNFGEDASLDGATTRGPHTVTYDRPGLKTVLLITTSSRGCVTTKVGTINVECCSDHFTIDGQEIATSCGDTSDGEVQLSASTAYGIASYEWSDGTTTQNLTGVPQGTYSVRLVDNATCEADASFTIGGPPPLEVRAAITMPTCNGGQDGRIQMQVSGGTPGYEYNFGSGFATADALPDIPIGDYPVTIRDANACEVDTTLEVRELELELDPAVSAITPPSCNGYSDGRIEVQITNGLGPYQYDWQDGAGFQDENSLSQISAGVYQVNVQDQNLCQGSFEFNVEDYEPVLVNISVTNVSCAGLQDGALTAITTGGTGSYVYNWSTGSRSSTIDQLAIGRYSVSVEDSNGCPVEATGTVIQPDRLLLTDILPRDVICFGENSGSLSLLGGGGSPPYSYSIDGGTNFQTDNSFLSLTAGTYSLAVMDAEGCIITGTGTVNQPPQLLVDAGADRILELGNTTVLQADPSEQPVLFNWSPVDYLTCTDCANPVAAPVNTTEFRVVATNPAGCSAEASVTVTLSKQRDLYIPNAFSPNGDGANDYFTIYGSASARIIRKLQVFDRWGNMLFQDEDIPLSEEVLGWNGTHKGQEMNSGVYVYVAEIEFIDDERIVYSGDITLIR